MSARLRHAWRSQILFSDERSKPDSKVRVLAIHTQEDWAIAQECWQLYAGNW